VTSIAILDTRSCNKSYTVWPQKSKLLPNYQKIVLNRIKACQRDLIYSSN